MLNPATYDHDFQAWITRNAELLRSGQLAEVDAERPSANEIS